MTGRPRNIDAMQAMLYAQYYQASANILVSPGKAPTTEALYEGMRIHQYLEGQSYSVSGWEDPFETIHRYQRLMKIDIMGWVSHAFLYGQKVDPVPPTWERVRDAHTLTYARDLPLVAYQIVLMNHQWSAIRRRVLLAYPTWQQHTELLYRVNQSLELTGRSLPKPITYRGLP